MDYAVAHVSVIKKAVTHNDTKRGQWFRKLDGFQKHCKYLRNKK